MDELKRKESDKIEILKQQQNKKTIVLQGNIQPKKNHTVFEYNTITKEIRKAEYEPKRTEIHWLEALEMFFKKTKQIDLNNVHTVTKSKILKKQNCIYDSALNMENFKNILKRNHNISIQN